MGEPLAASGAGGVCMTCRGGAASGAGGAAYCAGGTAASGAGLLCLGRFSGSIAKA